MRRIGHGGGGRMLVKGSIAIVITRYMHASMIVIEVDMRLCAR